jgi:hypothetical protein
MSVDTQPQDEEMIDSQAQLDEVTSPADHQVRVAVNM